ncbi:ferritin-like domain-containing protein [Microvirga sp. 2MCAF38]|uniref:YciE/YciF ferroxidase family protein n=1 Tax=Microvirga sp. 2MCAF38 TaxID=3232989 RepID=UPI003F9D2922
MPSEKNLDDLFLHTLKDMYFAEKQILKALPKMEKATATDELKKAFAHHRQQTETQIDRLDRVFEIIGARAQGVTCEAIKGIIEEGEDVMGKFEDSTALDAALVAAAQAVEHYEISRYGTLRTWAEQLGLEDAAKLLDQNLAEERETDKLLSKMAKASVNQRAAA